MTSGKAGPSWVCCACSRIARQCLHSFHRLIDNTASYFSLQIRIVCMSYMYSASADIVSRGVVYGYSNTPSETVSLHKIPSDKLRRQIWARFVCRTRARLKLEESAFICSKHFCDDEFANKLKFDTGYAQSLVLKETAIPTIYPTVSTDASSGKQTVTKAMSQLPVQRASGPQWEKLSGGSYLPRKSLVTTFKQLIFTINGL